MKKKNFTEAEYWLINFTLNHYDVLPSNSGRTDEEILNTGLKLLSHHYGIAFTRDILNEKFKG